MSVEDIIFDKLKNTSGTAPNNAERMTETVKKEAQPEQRNRAEDVGSSQLHMWIAEIITYISVMESTRENYAFRYIYSCRKWIGGIIVFFKRVVRKLLKWYIEPICFQQTEFNNAVTPSIGRLTECTGYLSQKTEELEQEKDQLWTAVKKCAGTEELQSLVTENAENSRALEERTGEALRQLAEENAENSRALEERTGETLRQLAEENAENSRALEERTGEALRQLAEENAENSRALEERTGEALRQLAEENAENTRVLEERTGEALRQLAEENHALHNSLNEMSAAFQELKAMLVLNQTGLEELKDDMDCVRETDASIFEHSQKSFFDKKTCSQSGEDSIIAYILMVLGYHPDEITYLDLGANHAQELSNTYYFYSKGAHGVLVEANPALIPELKLLRHRDTILNYCVTDHDDDVVAFYILSGDGLSTSDYESAQAALATNANLSISGTEKIKTITIKRILEDYMKTAPTLLNIDIEGCEMAVLTDYDFANYRPTVICVEMIPYETGLVIEKKNSEVADLLKEKGYVEYAFTGINSIFIDRSKLNGGNKS